MPTRPPISRLRRVFCQNTRPIASVTTPSPRREATRWRSDSVVDRATGGLAEEHPLVLQRVDGDRTVREGPASRSSRQAPRSLVTAAQQGEHQGRRMNGFISLPPSCPLWTVALRLT